MRVGFVELPKPLRVGGLEKAAADMARYLEGDGVVVTREGIKEGVLRDFDLIHFHGLWAPSHARVASACKQKQIPCIVSPHGMLEPWAWRHRKWKKWPYFYLIEKRRLQRANALLATAEEEAQNIRARVPGQNVDVLTLGIEPDVFPDYENARRKLGWGADERVLLYLSRVHPKKGLWELLQAFKELPEATLRAVRLVILGDGPADYVTRCQKAVESLQSRLKIEWYPPQWGEAKWPYLQGADLFCLPTYSENFGIVMLEAGIVGTPVFTTTGTPWKCIETAGFGYVPPQDPKAYVKVLESFFQRDAPLFAKKRQAFAGWTRENYAWPNLVERYKAYYTRIIEEAQ